MVCTISGPGRRHPRGPVRREGTPRGARFDSVLCYNVSLVVVSPSCSTSVHQDADQPTHAGDQIPISLLKLLEASLVITIGVIVCREGCPRGARFEFVLHYYNVSFVVISAWRPTSIHQGADLHAHVADKIPIVLFRLLEVF